MPVDWNSRSNRPSKPCKLTSVLWLRAILRTSIRVATPELSIWVTADRSTVSTLQRGPCNVVRSSARIAGEESISKRPQIRAVVPFSPVTTSISGLSIRLVLLPSNGIPSFPPECREFFATDYWDCAAKRYGTSMAITGQAAIPPLSNTCPAMRNCCQRVGNIWADTCPNKGRCGQRRPDPIKSAIGSGALSSPGTNHTRSQPGFGWSLPARLDFWAQGRRCGISANCSYRWDAQANRNRWHVV